MVSGHVVVKNPGPERWADEGAHEFHVLPRIGECIDLTFDHDSYAYEVVGIHHSAKPSGAIPCFIYTVRIGTVTEAVTRLLEESPVAR